MSQRALSASEIKLVRSLSVKKYRERERMFVIEGEKMLGEAMAAGFEPLKVYRREEIGEQQMARISSQDSPAPVLAVLRMRDTDLSAPAEGLSLALDGIRDPGNLGTILRIADWFSVERIYASEDTVDVYNPKVVQASMGAIFRKSVTYCSLEALIKEFRSRSIPVFGTLLDGGDMYSSPLEGNALIVMGSESAGIREGLRPLLDHRIRIPSYGGGAESLNVAVATAVTLAEFRRRFNV